MLEAPVLGAVEGPPARAARSVFMPVLVLPVKGGGATVDEAAVLLAELAVGCLSNPKLRRAASLKLSAAERSASFMVPCMEPAASFIAFAVVEAAGVAPCVNEGGIPNPLLGAAAPAAAELAAVEGAVDGISKPPGRFMPPDCGFINRVVLGELTFPGMIVGWPR